MVKCDFFIKQYYICLNFAQASSVGLFVVLINKILTLFNFIHVLGIIPYLSLIVLNF